jgi:hypothetical protein
MDYEIFRDKTVQNFDFARFSFPGMCRVGVLVVTFPPFFPDSRGPGL